MRYEFITRQGCHLCERALDELKAQGVEPELIDIDGRPDLLATYDFRVPVLLLNGQVVGEGLFSPSWLSPTH